MPAVARVGDRSSHGGTIVSGAVTVMVDGQPVARVGDMHVCGDPQHGTTPIITGSAKHSAEGAAIARVGDLVGCGAVITEGSPTTDCD